MERLEQSKHHSTTSQLTSNSQRPSSRNVSRENLEHAQSDNPYSKSYNQYQSRPYDPTNYDHFESDPVRASSRVPKNHQVYPNRQITPGAVTDPNTQQQLERQNMNRASARYRKNWNKPKVNPKGEDALFADLDPLANKMKNMSIEPKKPTEAESMEVDYAPTSHATSTLYNPAADPPISTQSSDLISMDEKADSFGIHNVKKGNDIFTLAG